MPSVSKVSVAAGSIRALLLQKPHTTRGQSALAALSRSTSTFSSPSLMSSCLRTSSVLLKFTRKRIATRLCNQEDPSEIMKIISAKQVHPVETSGVVYEWPKCTVLISNLASNLQDWAREYCKNSHGALMRPFEDGVILNLFPGSGSNITLTVSRNSQKTLKVSYNLSPWISTDKVAIGAFNFVVENFLNTLRMYLTELDINNINDASFPMIATAPRSTVPATTIGANGAIGTTGTTGMTGVTGPAEPRTKESARTSTAFSGKIHLNPAFVNDTKSLSLNDVRESEIKDSIKIIESANTFLKKGPLVRTDVPRTRDNDIIEQARDIGLRLEKYEGRGIEESAFELMMNMVNATKRQGFLSTLLNILEKNSTATNDSDAENVLGTTASTDLAADNSEETLSNFNSSQLSNLMKKGSDLTERMMKILEAGNPDSNEDLSRPVAQFPIMRPPEDSEMGLDIMQGPPQHLLDNPPESSVLGEALKKQEFEAYNILPPFLRPDPNSIEEDRRRLQFLVLELNQTTPDIHPMILDSYKEILLSNNLLFLIREATAEGIDNSLRGIYQLIISKAVDITQQLMQLANQESLRHLTTIQQICRIAAEFQDDEEKFLINMDLIKPKFDADLLSYLEFAINEEKHKCTSMEPSQWLKVLLIVQRGVYAEFETRFDRILEPILTLLRFDEDHIRTALFERFVEIAHPTDLYHMRQLTENMIGGVLSGKFSKELTDKSIPRKLELLEVDLKRIMTDEYIESRMDKYTQEVRSVGQDVYMEERRKLYEPGTEEFNIDKLEGMSD